MRLAIAIVCLVTAGAIGNASCAEESDALESDVQESHAQAFNVGMPDGWRLLAPSGNAHLVHDGSLYVLAVSEKNEQRKRLYRVDLSKRTTQLLGEFSGEQPRSIDVLNDTVIAAQQHGDKKHSVLWLFRLRKEDVLTKKFIVEGKSVLAKIVSPDQAVLIGHFHTTKKDALFSDSGIDVIDLNDGKVRKRVRGFFPGDGLIFGNTVLVGTAYPGSLTLFDINLGEFTTRKADWIYEMVRFGDLAYTKLLGDRLRVESTKPFKSVAIPEGLSKERGDCHRLMVDEALKRLIIVGLTGEVTALSETGEVSKLKFDQPVKDWYGVWAGNVIHRHAGNVAISPLLGT